jgi:hypothetical protein
MCEAAMLAAVQDRVVLCITSHTSACFTRLLDDMSVVCIQLRAQMWDR